MPWLRTPPRVFITDPRRSDYSGIMTTEVPTRFAHIFLRSLGDGVVRELTTIDTVGLTNHGVRLGHVWMKIDVNYQRHRAENQRIVIGSTNYDPGERDQSIEDVLDLLRPGGLTWSYNSASTMINITWPANTTVPDTWWYRELGLVSQPTTIDLRGNVWAAGANRGLALTVTSLSVPRTATFSARNDVPLLQMAIAFPRSEIVSDAQLLANPFMPFVADDVSNVIPFELGLWDSCIGEQISAAALQNTEVDIWIEYF